MRVSTSSPTDCESSSAVPAQVAADLDRGGAAQAPAALAVSLNAASGRSDAIAAAVFDAFEYHPWTPEQIELGKSVRSVLTEAVLVIIATVPPSADRSAAIRKIREARMDCNSAITHNGRY